MSYPVAMVTAQLTHSDHALPCASARLLTAGPEEQLVDAAHYQGSMEHFRLSQGEALDQTPPDVAHAITASVAQGTHTRAHYRHSMVSALHHEFTELHMANLLYEHYKYQYIVV